MSKIIYGTDDRLDYYQTPQKYQVFAKNSVVALMEESTLGHPDSNGVYHPPIQFTLAYGFDVCPDARFASQPALSFCSGTLIGVDRVMTAGHCLDSCEGFKIVFDYLIVNAQGDLEDISEDDVYSCRNFYSVEGSIDYAIIQLDRPVVDRTYLNVRDFGDNSVSMYQNLIMMGFPSGIPMKYDTGFVTNTGANDMTLFMGSVDSFGGNSGSGVLNEDDEVVGILVFGNEDYTPNAQETCYYPNVIPCTQSYCNNGVTEGITYAYLAVRAAPACTQDSDCDDSESGSYCHTECEEGVTGCTGWCSGEPEEEGLSDGAIAGIVIGVLVFVGLVAGGIFWMVSRRGRGRHMAVASPIYQRPPERLIGAKE
jgi:V8-like Glu-specific endopeptidase